MSADNSRHFFLYSFELIHQLLGLMAVPVCESPGIYLEVVNRTPVFKKCSPSKSGDKANLAQSKMPTNKLMRKYYLSRCIDSMRASARNKKDNPKACLNQEIQLFPK